MVPSLEFHINRESRCERGSRKEPPPASGTGPPLALQQVEDKRTVSDIRADVVTDHPSQTRCCSSQQDYSVFPTDSRLCSLFYKRFQGILRFATGSHKRKWVKMFDLILFLRLIHYTYLGFSSVVIQSLP